MTTDELPEGAHDDLLRAEFRLLDADARARFVTASMAVFDQLAACRAENVEVPPQPYEEGRPRVSPWAWRQMHRACPDHEGHAQHVLRRRAAELRELGDPTWRCWLAMAERRRASEVLRHVEQLEGLAGSDGVGA